MKKKAKVFRKPWEEDEEIVSVSYGPYKAFALKNGTVYIIEGYKIKSKKTLNRIMTESSLKTHIDYWIKTSGVED